MSLIAGSADRAFSQVPSSLSGIQTTCVMPHSFRAATTEEPSYMASSQGQCVGRGRLSPAHQLRLSTSMRLMAAHAAGAQLGVRRHGRALVLGLGGRV